MTLWSASDPASPLFMPLRGSKNSNSLPPISSLSSPAPIPTFCFSLNPLFLFLSFLSALSSQFWAFPSSFLSLPTPSEQHHTDSESETPHRDLSKWHGGGGTTVWHPDPASYILSIFKCEHGAGDGTDTLTPTYT